MTPRYLDIPEDLALFSEKYHNSTAENPCVVCGRETSKNSKGLGVIVAEGGSSLLHPDDEDTDPAGFMGWWAVGTECIKKVPKEYRTTLEGMK